MKARQNPFAAHRIDALAYRFTSTGWDELLFKLKHLNYRASIIGPYGSGKTTLLEQLGARLEHEGWKTSRIFINAQSARLRLSQWKMLMNASRENIICLIDGADLLPAWQWAMVRLITHRAKGLIIAGHRANGLPVLMTCQTSEDILDDVLNELTGSLDDELRQTGHALFRQHNGNIREVFRALYLVFAEY